VSDPVVVVTATASVPSDAAAALERQVTSVLRSAGDATRAQVTLRREAEPRAAGPYVADVIAVRAGQVIAAHAVGASPDAAGDALLEALRRRLAGTEA
jgi:hypothetical protein